MPHVVIEEAGDLQGVYQAFTPFDTASWKRYSQSSGILPGTKRQIGTLGVNYDRTGCCVQLLCPTQAPRESYHCASLPATDPEKTPAVKKVMAMVAGLIRNVYPGSRYGKTNLQEYLEATTDSK